ncbi:MAG: tetraacyldisaccharide 4'-kinase [Epsilonproteobacteria bacterium]|nr:tetraacyldisaccharide 4'-kinase [Campylobacterota bacterium]
MVRPYTCKKSLVLGVGNIAVGGTGKTVFTSFLIELLGFDRVAVVMRGYGGSAQQSSGKLINRQDGMVEAPNVVGDEAYMLASAHKCSVAVGKKRDDSCRRLEKKFSANSAQISYIILDDAYQNFLVKKDCEILLLDARMPFSNEHCLPAGRLREKDISRADVIILTHADRVDSVRLRNISLSIEGHGEAVRIFTGRHVPKGVYLKNDELLNNSKNKKFLACAGIGSFGSFKQTLEQIVVPVFGEVEYDDHHQYDMADIEHMLAEMKKSDCDGIITTQKDWVKIDHVLTVAGKQKQKDWFYVLRIGFEFLSEQEYSAFRLLLDGLEKKE